MQYIGVRKRPWDLGVRAEMTAVKISTAEVTAAAGLRENLETRKFDSWVENIRWVFTSRDASMEIQ